MKQLSKTQMNDIIAERLGFSREKVDFLIRNNLKKLLE